MTSITAAHHDKPLPEPVLRLFRARKYSQCLVDLEQLAKQGSTPAAVALAHIFFYGGDGIRRNYEIARQWLELIVQDDDRLVYANYRLGILHYHGFAISKDHQKAYRFFRRASLRRDPKSLLMVAAMQREGDGVQRKRRSAKIILVRSMRDRRLGFWKRFLAFLWAATIPTKAAERQRGRR